MGSKRKRRRQVAMLPPGVRWWIPRQGAGLVGVVDRIIIVPDEWGAEKHAVIVLAVDGYDHLLAIPDCVRARAISQAVTLGSHLMIESRGWQPQRNGRMMRDIRIHVGRVPETY